MKKPLRLSTLCIACLSIPLLVISLNASAQPHKSSHARAYDNGYDDGYEDAMDDCPCPPSLYVMSGFYAGLGIGYEGFQINRDILDFNNRIAKFSTHANGWNGRLLGGYGRYINDSNYYLGGEVFVGTSGASGKDSVDSISYDGKFSAQNSWGFSLLPGYRLHKDGPLVYARLGYIDTDFKVTDSIGSTNSKHTHWTSGFDTGIGVEIPLYKHFSARLEYEYIDYSSANNPGTLGSDNSPSDNRGSLTFLYRF